MQLEINGIEYESVYQPIGCNGCAFNFTEECNEANGKIDCQVNEIIWIKKEQPKKVQEDTSCRIHPDSGQIELSQETIDYLKGFTPEQYSKIFSNPNSTALSEQLPGTKYDEDKLQYSLVPPYALEAIARNLTIGLKKYKERDNWKKVPNAQDRYLDALMRHLEAVRRGEIFDPDSSVPDMPHMAAVAVNSMFLLEFMLNPELQEPKEEKT